MAKRLTIQITREELQRLFQALRIWEKIRDGRLTTEEIAKSRSPSGRWPTATSMMLRHRNAAGLQVATTHRIQYPDGRTLHRDASNLLVGDIVLYR